MMIESPPNPPRLAAAVNWLEHRTGCGKILHAALYENVPGGARWRYVWGSTLTFAIVVQFITGVFLWMAYSPSSQTAWESVYYIQDVMTGGWLLRGLHHYTAHVMIILLALHLMQVVIDGAYKAPREVNFWFGVVLLQFIVDRSGQVPKLVIATPSGSESLDRAAVAGISASVPFPPLPAEYKGQQIRLQFAFKYNVK